MTEPNARNASLPFSFELTIEGAREYRNLQSRESLLRELNSGTTSTAAVLEWVDEPKWDDEAQCLNLRCTAAGDTLERLAEQAVTELAAAANRVTPGGDRTVRVRGTGVVVPARVSEHSTRERWGWYAVTLQLESRAIGDDPKAAPYIDAELRKWQRFRLASFGWDQSQDVGLFSVQVVARSAAGADGEARDALENFIWITVKEPGAYEISTVRLEWLSDPDDPPGSAREA